jgi:nucleotide-binding universal stress UspA family protein
MYRQAEDRLNSFLERNETTGLLPPRFLSAEGTPLRKSTDALVDYIKASGTDLVVLSTHARKGMPRLFLGSFAETLMLYSPVPILVVNPQVRAATSIDQFLFPTDFSDESREVYLRTLDLAKVFGARVILMHQVEYLYPDLLYPFVIPPVEPGSVAEVERAQENLGKEWVRLAQEQGADIEFRLIPHGRDLGAELEKVSRYYSTVIAMASRSGELSSALLGSRTRRIVREGHSPVLVFHPVRTRAKQRAA